MSFRNLLLTSLAMATVLLPGCTKETTADNGTNELIGASANALIDLPSSIAAEPVVARSAAVDPAIDLYDGVRFQAWFVNQLVWESPFSARQVILNFADALPWDSIVKVGTLTFANDSESVSGSYEADAELPYTASIVKSTGADVSAAFNGDWENPEGWVWYCLPQMGNANTDSLRILVEFSKNGNNRDLHVTITQNVKTSSAEEGRSFDYTMKQEGDIIHLSACSYHPNSKLTGDAVGRCYEYTAVIDNLKNIAKVNLGFPSGSVTSSDTSVIFGTYGVANVFGNEFIDKDLATANDTIKGLVVTSIETGTQVDSLLIKAYAGVLLGDNSRAQTILANAPKAADLTPADLITYGAINRNVGSGQDQENLAALLWILKLSQPVYFQGATTGNPYYAGNANDVPAGFEAIATRSCALPTLVPVQVRDLIVAKP